MSEAQSDFPVSLKLICGNPERTHLLCHPAPQAFVPLQPPSPGLMSGESRGSVGDFWFRFRLVPSFKSASNSRKLKLTRMHKPNSGQRHLVTYLSHVPIAIFFRYPICHLGSAGYPHCPVVRKNPSFARRGRKAEKERQDAKGAPSPSGVVDHLPPTFNQTLLLLLLGRPGKQPNFSFRQARFS